MNIPKIKFREMTLKENIDLIKWAYFENNDSLNVHNYTIQCFPELADVSKNLTKEEIYKFIDKVVSSHYEKNRKEITQEIE